MKLAEIKNISVDILKDASFNWMAGGDSKVDGKEVLSYLEHKSFLKILKSNKNITAVIVNKEMLNDIKDMDIGIILSNTPRIDFFKIHNHLYNNNFYNFTKENTISDSAIIMDNVHILGTNIVIEENVLIEPNVTIYDNVTIKKNSIIRTGVVISGNTIVGITDEEGNLFKGQTIGSVLIDENVEIRNNTIIDKGIFAETYIGKNCLIDGLVSIGHDAQIHENSRIIIGSIVAGYSVIKANTTLNPGTIVTDRVTVGNNSKITIGSVVMNNIKANTTSTGYFAINHDKYLQEKAFVKNSLRNKGVK